MPSRQHEAWSDEDVAAPRLMINARNDIIAIVRALERSPKDVRSKIRQIRLTYGG